jgi:large subunit ribosomal protein L30
MELNAGSKVRVTLIKSLIGRQKKQIQTATALGLTKIRDSREYENNRSIQGMINLISHLLRVESVV